MKLTAEMLKKIIREIAESTISNTKDTDRFLHGEDPQDSEGAMAISKFSSICEMAEELKDLLQEDDQLPGWVQDHISVAHENIQQVHGYLTGVGSSK